MTDQRHDPRNTTPEPPRQPGELLFSTIILILVVAFFITVAALCYGIITTPPSSRREIQSLAFPWVGWAASMLIAPVVIMGLARAVRGPSGAKNAAGGEGTRAAEEQWAGQLPPKARKLYDFLRNAPLVVFSLAFVALGVTLLVIDGAFSLIRDIAVALVPYLPHFLGAATVIAVAVIGFMTWYRLKNNQLSADYAFRREVMEKTGVVLVDSKGKALLPPGDGREGYTVIRIPDASIINEFPKALPEALLEGGPKTANGGVLDVESGTK